MPDIRDFDALSQYNCSIVRIRATDGETSDLVVGTGGGLNIGFESLGREPLLRVLTDDQVDGVWLIDGELEVSAQRQGVSAKLRVKQGDTLIIDELVNLPPVQVRWTGPWFRPDPDQSLTLKSLVSFPEPWVALKDGAGTQWVTKGYYGEGVNQQPMLGVVPSFFARDLGSRRFQQEHNLQLSYVAGAMAGGISSVELVEAMAKNRLLAFFGAGGLPTAAIDSALLRLSHACEPGTYGANLLHNPADASAEWEVVRLFLSHGVQNISASAFMSLTPAVVWARFQGIFQDDSGNVVVPNRLFAKVSRPEIARLFAAPPSRELLNVLIARGVLTEEQAVLASQVTIASAITAEADSGGHTDHRPLPVLFPAILREVNRVAASHKVRAPFVGAAGGLGTPEALHGAFSMGADYVLTGSINQATVEAGTSDVVKKMLSEAAFYDVASGPAPDMFELGAKVQVLSRGSMYASKATKLHQWYQQHTSIDDLSVADKKRLEKRILKKSVDEVWADTVSYWTAVDVAQVERANRDGKHKMALIFRWYLGQSSRWATSGAPGRRADYQIWTGPCMGAFNDWAQGTELEPLANRTVVRLAQELMDQCALLVRVQLAKQLSAFEV